MPLTRPKAAQVNFDVTNITDPLIRINSGESGSADKDTGIVMERGSDGNVALIYDESANHFAVINTDEVGTTSGNVTITSYADIKANAFYGDGSNLTGVSGAFTAESDGASLTDTSTGSSAGPVITLTRNASDTAADGNYLGQLKFKGDNDAGSSQVFAKITGKIDDASDGTEDGLLEFANKKAGSNVITARLTSTELKLINGTGLEVAGLTYPTADGSAGQQLTTDGSGVLSWADSGSSGSVGRTKFTFNITGSVTTLSGTDANSATLAYTAEQIDVYVNGVRVSAADITATNGTSIVFGETLVAGDVVDIIAHNVIDVSQIGTGRTLFNYSISGTPTTVSGSDSNGNTLAYTVGQIDVFVNGIRMAPVDITATNGTSVVFGVALVNSDVVDIIAYTAFDVVTNNADDLSSGTVPDARITGAYTGITNLTATGVGSFGSLDISGDVDVDGTLEADAITVNGVALATVIAGTTVTNADHVYVDESEDDNTYYNLAFLDTGAGDGFRTLQVDAGGLMFNPYYNRLVVNQITDGSGSGAVYVPSGIKIGSDATANTLDDYEEGTWTATLTGSTTNPSTAVTVAGTYTKIGNMCYAQFQLSNVNSTGASGGARITGLPFTASGSQATGNVMTYVRFTLGTGSTNISPYVSGTQIAFYQSTSNGGWSEITHNAGTGAYISASVFYKTT